MRQWHVWVAAPIMAVSLMLTGCGDSGSSSSTPSAQSSTSRNTAPSTPAAPAAPAVPPAMTAFTDDGNVVELTLEGDDRMQFNKDRFDLKPGQMVRLTLKHVGNLPAQSMGHNVVILKPGDDPFEFGADVNERGGAMSNDYVPQALRGRVVAYTKIIGGGQTTHVEFRTPDEPGEYPFLCSFPGHAGMMNGIVHVKE